MGSAAIATTVRSSRLNDGYAELLAWAIGLGRVVAFGVEGCSSSYGMGLARFLRRHG
jgi:hypothetical protein